MGSTEHSPAIRDETGEPVLGVDPVRILEWAMRPWSDAERAEFRKIILVSDEVTFKRRERALLEAGGCALKRGIDSKTYWFPEKKLVGIFDLSRDREKTLRRAGGRYFGWLVYPYHRLKYRNRMRIDIAYDSYVMLGFARASIAQREQELTGNALYEASSDIYNSATREYYKRLLFQSTVGLTSLLLLVIYGLSFVPNALWCWLIPSRASNRNAVVDDVDGEPLASTDDHERAPDGATEPRGAGVESKSMQKRTEEPTIHDKTGEHLFGIDPGKVLRQMLRIWRPEDRAFLTEIVLVGCKSSEKAVEADLVKRRCKPLHPKQRRCRTYVSRQDGAVAVFELSELRGKALEYKTNHRMNCLRTCYARWAYRIQLRSIFLRDLHTALAWARAATESGASNSSKKRISERKDKLFFGPLAKTAMKRVRYWRTLIDTLLLVLLLITRGCIWTKKAE